MSILSESGGGGDKITRSRQKTNQLIHLRRLLEHFEGNKEKTAEAIGLGINAINQYLSDGEMTVTSALACEAMLRRLGTAAPYTYVLFITMPRGNLETIQTLGNSLGVETIYSAFDEPGMVPAGVSGRGLLVLDIPPNQLKVLTAVISALGGTIKQQMRQLGNEPTIRATNTEGVN